MFDNYPTANNQSSGARPSTASSSSSAEDIFSDLEQRNGAQAPVSYAQAAPVQAAPQSAPAPVNYAQPLARPVAAPQYSQAPRQSFPPVGPVPSGGSSSVKFLIIGLVSLVVLLGGGFYLYQTILLPNFSIKSDIVVTPTATTGNIVVQENPSYSDVVPVAAVIPTSSADQLTIISSTVNSVVVTDQALNIPTSTPLATSTVPDIVPMTEVPTVNIAKDSDLDGLTDVEEKKLGTNPLSKDTDGDGLSDYDEVNLWKTDPLRADTDGDTYPDGTEVKNGYNPNGPGKITTFKK